MPPPGRRRRLGDLLIESGLISETQLKAALNEQRKWGGRLGRTVVELGFVTETAIGLALARQLELPSVDLDTVALPPAAPTWLRLDLCERYGVFPLEINPAARAISIATSDPTNVEHLQALEFATNLKVMPTVATASAIERAIRKYYFGEHDPAPSAPPVVAAATARAAATPKEPAFNATSFELDELLGDPPRKTTELPALNLSAGPTVPPAVAVNPLVEMQLRKEIAVLREKAEGLEEINASQVRALRVLLELLIESGLVTRDEYLEKLHAPE
jgi:type IV pilus assembly protein PilB